MKSNNTFLPIIFTILVIFYASITEVKGQACGADMVMVVDISCSITPPNKTIMHNFLIEFISVLNIGSGDDELQLGMVLFDKFVYNPFFLNTFSDKNQIIEEVRNMDIHQDNKKRARCGTRTDLALRETLEVQLTEENGLRSNIPSVFPLVLIITDGATHPPEKAPNTIRNAIKLKKESGSSVFVLSLPNRNNIDGTIEFTALASKPTERFLITVSSFDAIVFEIPPLLTEMCIPPIVDTPLPPPEPTTTEEPITIVAASPEDETTTTPPPTTTIQFSGEFCEDPANKKLHRKCGIWMSACPPSRRECCGCPYMFKRKGKSKKKGGLAFPMEATKFDKTCLCMNCIRQSAYCLPDDFKHLALAPKKKFRGFGKSGKNRNRDNEQ